ncbi:hypothetical protein WMF30_26040 [Sorangium sp. So ce134]
MHDIGELAPEAAYDAFLSKVAWQALPDGPGKSLAEVALRGVLHSLLDPCVAIDRLGGGDIFERFLAWAAEARASMGWQVHLSLIEWLAADAVYRDRITGEHLLEAMTAAASRWAMLDRGPACGVVIGCSRLPDKIVVGWKCRAPDEGKRIEILTVSDVPAPSKLIGWSTTLRFDLDDVEPWSDVPP